jgi:hypothetical protein
MITTEQLDSLKDDYAWMIVDGLDLKTLCQLAAEMIADNIKDYDYDDLREEIVDCYGEETWTDMVS